MSLITALLFFCLCLIFHKLSSPNRKILYFIDKIPGPKIYPIIGNGWYFLSKKPLLQIMNELSATYGSVIRLWVGKKLFVVLSDPADVEAILSSTTKHLNKSGPYRLFDSWLCNTSLFTSNVSIWRVHRKLLTPSFHFKILENSVNMITRNVDILVDQLEGLVDGADFDIEPYIDKCALDIICETAMGIRLETQLSKNTAYLDCIQTVGKMIMKRMTLPWLHPDFIFNITSEGRLYYKSLQVIKAEGRKVINQRKKILEEKLEVPLIIEKEGGKSTQPFLDFLLTKSGFTDAEIESEVQTFMFGGHDTTKSALSFCLYSLSQNADVQNKLVEEIKTIFMEKKGHPNYRDYTEMKYLECVIKETMRLFPPGPFISRKVSENVKLPSGYELPAGSLVGLAIFNMHRSEHIYPDAEKFLPERFLVRDSNRSLFAYIPFSAGPRNCLGQKFAMIEMRVVVSKLLLKYEFLPAIKSESPILETSLVIHSLNKLPVRIRRRNLC